MDNAVITETKKGWISGFEEPSHIPDFFVRTVTFTAMNGVTTITIRRPLKPSNPTIAVQLSKVAAARRMWSSEAVRG
jgi:hypothetical protein